MKNGIIDAAVSRERCTVMIRFRALADLTPLESNTGIRTPSILPSQSIDYCMALTCYVARLSKKSSVQYKGTPCTVRCRADPP
jgi:hypothetical protein